MIFIHQCHSQKKVPLKRGTQIDDKLQSGRLLRKFRVQGAKKVQGRRVLPVRKDLNFLQQRSNRDFVSSLSPAKTRDFSMVSDGQSDHARDIANA